MELQRRDRCLCHCKSVDLSSGTCMHGGFCKAWLKLGMPKCTGTQGISQKIDINGSCCYVSGWVMRLGLLCCWIRCLNEVTPLSQTAAADKTCLRYFMLLFNSGICVYSLMDFLFVCLFFTAICLCHVCVCCDSLGSVWMDHSSHPRVPAEITSTTVTSMLRKTPTLFMCGDLLAKY